MRCVADCNDRRLTAFARHCRAGTKPFLLAAACGLFSLHFFAQQMLLVAITLSVTLLLVSYRRRQPTSA